MPLGRWPWRPTPQSASAPRRPPRPRRRPRPPGRPGVRCWTPLPPALEGAIFLLLFPPSSDAASRSARRMRKGIAARRFDLPQLAALTRAQAHFPVFFAMIAAAPDLSRKDSGCFCFRQLQSAVILR